VEAHLKDDEILYDNENDYVDNETSEEDEEDSPTRAQNVPPPLAPCVS